MVKTVVGPVPWLIVKFLAPDCPVVFQFIAKGFPTSNPPKPEEELRSANVPVLTIVALFGSRAMVLNVPASTVKVYGKVDVPIPKFVPSKTRAVLLVILVPS